MHIRNLTVPFDMPPSECVVLLPFSAYILYSSSSGTHLLTGDTLPLDSYNP